MKIKKIKLNFQKNKKAISEIVSYVLLIVIALGLASGVYFWIKNYLPSQNEREQCSEDVSLELSTYSCNQTQKIFSATIKNNGFFNVSGFFIRASNSTDEKKTFDRELSCNIPISCSINSRFDFQPALKNSQEKKIEFSYANAKPLKRIQIQPYVLAKKEKNLLLCKAVNLNLEACD